ncbi:MAG: hypothetical protein N2652_05750 [Kiritimatiellae bacterium]|nr:hypothetical protein [Kiritimatiellia bacterium]
MKLRWWVCATAGATAVLVGCDWEAGSGAQTVSNRYNWVNFSGVYRAVSGAFLVNEPGSGGSATTNTVSGERVATAVAGQSTYAGVLSRRRVLPGTFQIVAGVYVLTDNGAGVLSGSGKTGSIVYQTGAWSIDLLGAWPPAGTPILATYQYLDDADPGSSGGGLYTFSITQSGNAITIVDSSGGTYSGRISSIRSTGGVSSDEASVTPLQPVVGDTLVASFEAEGRSRAGVAVKIVGTLSGTVAGTAGGGGGGGGGAVQIYLNNRRLQGTWIEANGRTGDIVGVAQ